MPFLPASARAEPDLSLVLVEKSATLRSHAGQVAFPGGGVEPADADLARTALREAEEEVGLPSAEVDLIGLLPPLEAVTGHHVTPVVGWWGTPTPLVPVDVVEVADVHVVSVADLADPAHRFTWEHRLGYKGPAFVVGDLFIWGLTAYLLDSLLQAGGWAVPWDTERVAAIPARFDGAARRR